LIVTGKFREIAGHDGVKYAGLRRDNREKMRHKAQIWGVYVRQAMRQQGVANALLCAAIDAARHMPEVATVLLSVDAASMGAKKLYVALGFETYGIEHDSILVDGVYVHEERMRLTLRLGTGVGL
jgi:ribosomal protein S18 acetylase RimI-like enzyme